MEFCEEYTHCAAELNGKPLEFFRIPKKLGNLLI